MSGTSHIRRLRPGDPIPTDEPRRYRKQGYVVLRWKIGPRKYVDCLEHRIVDGRVTTAEHVHHANHVRDDNRPANLVESSAAEHYAHHGEGRRRFSPEAAAELYLSGLSTTQVAVQLGARSSSTISRALRQRGVTMRPSGGATSHAARRVALDTVRPHLTHPTGTP